MRLKNKIAILTGATGGIGEATAHRFISEGAKIAIVDIQKEKIEKLAKEIGQDKALALTADVTDAISVKELQNKNICSGRKTSLIFI